ncbi:CPBP family intramembrane glutamic endopeptidase [Spirillospora albida]|uniref:CPBP family intramembrane glutamic endopeptidase n=1 Tax=Spirillospora albida TaxID=58123 RepID=UPI00068C7D02|nr:CPBP family intramembrane glutamic endopeptidase [Spirillospora albida]
MPEPGNDDGWAPVDPELDRPAAPPAPADPPQPGPAQPYAPPSSAHPYVPPQVAHPYVPPQAQAPHPHPYPYPPGPYQGRYGIYGEPQEKRPWTVDTEPGVPYHRMARTAVHRWWRPLVGSLAIVAGGFALSMALMVVVFVGVVIATGGIPESGDGDTITGDETVDLAFNLGTLALFLPVTLLVARWVQRRRPGTLSSVTGRLRRRWLGVCSVLAIGYCAAAYVTSLIVASLTDDTSGGDEHWVGWARFLMPMVTIVLLVPFQAAAEEYVFRGWLIQGIGACTLENLKGRVGRVFGAVFGTPWPGIVISAALFTSLHGYTGWGILDIFFFGAIAGWLTVRTGGLEAAIALHVFNNWIAFLLPAGVGDLEVEQGDVPWQVVVADIVPMVLFAAGVLVLARRCGVRTVTPPAEDVSVPVSVPAEDTPEPERVEDARSDGKIS